MAGRRRGSDHPMFRHGHYVGSVASRTYRIWRNMRNRCERPTHRAYRYYGGAGVRVCDRWGLFENFLADMGEAPDGCSIDRIDGNKGYEPSNCRWATQAQQMRNTSATIQIEYRGEVRAAVDWAQARGIKPATLYARLARGLPLDRALSSKDLRK